MKRYPLAYNPILEYWDKIESGQETVGKKVRKVYKHLAEKCYNTSGEFHYDPRRGNHILEFAENYCVQSKGKYGGKLVKLELFEKALLAAMFGFVDNSGKREYQIVILIEAKKNGKSLLASIVGDYLLTADGERGPEVYAVATKRDQAKIIWNEAKRMVQKSPALFSRVKPLVAELQCPGNDGVFKPLSSDSNSLDGLNVHGALMDEIHQWRHGQALYDIIIDGMIAREQPLAFITSTAGTVREDLYDTLYELAERVINGWNDPDGYHDERFLPIFYELDDRSEWTKPECWKKANPGLGTIKPIKALEEKVKKAMANPDMVKNLVCKEFNIRETSTEAWLTFEEVDNRDTYRLDPVNKKFYWTHNGEEKELPYPRYGIGGADLSATTDLTAAKVIFCVPGTETIFVLSMYWLVDDLIEQRAREDKIPYDKWKERDLVRGSDGTEIDYRDVKAWFEYVNDVLDIHLSWIGYDAWSAVYWVQDMTDRFGESAMIPVRQGVKTLSAPMKSMGRKLGKKLIVYNNNPVDKWCLTNTAKKEDVNGNIQPHKTSKATKRIDGTAALLDAYVIYLDHQQEYIGMIGG